MSYSPKENQSFFNDYDNLENNRTSPFTDFIASNSLFQLHGDNPPYDNYDEYESLSIQKFDLPSNDIPNQEETFNNITFEDNNQNNVNINNSDSNENSNNRIVLRIFNRKFFNDNYPSLCIRKNENNTNPYPIKTLRQIIVETRDNNIDILWSHDFPIFDNELDLLNSENLGFCSKLFHYLEGTKYRDDKIRNINPDEIFKRVQTSLIEESRNFLNKTIESINKNEYKIFHLKYNAINKHTKSDFSLVLLKQPLYAIFSNESNKRSDLTNYQKFEKLIELNDNRINNVISLELQSCLDIFRFTKQDSSEHFQKKVFNFLCDVYKEQSEKKKELKYSIKDYIACLLLMTFNYERFLYERLGWPNRKTANN